ncbi:EpsG family protein [Sporosarcina highlanderae]|uniref:EpsG family protein n=1 Tax=Sporosarcina highlanderae TaxID=3035916 RepID=A0ABT8JP30_9BACL|nr:EpsG family protein [Sporosarcina highlanderae]MDN4605924.1 EpsG family protein [Sporosarcina highlanderae]
MYLTERLIALFTYVIVLWLICFLIYKLGNRYIGKILFIYTIILSTMSFFFVPAPGADLYRLIPIMHIWGSLSFSELFKEMLNSTTPINLLYMHLIGKTKIDGLLPAITALIFYNNVFYILKRSVIRYKLPSSDAALVLFFFMSLGVMIEVISGIRTMLGFSIIAVCVYKEMLEGKSIFKNVIWYVLASLLHPAVLMLTLIRLSYLFFEKSKNQYQRFLKVLFAIFAVAIIYTFGREYVLASIEKAENYILYGTFSYIWEYIIGGISLLFIIYLISLVSRSIKMEGDTDNVRKLLIFCKYIAVILFVSSIEYNTFHRLVIFLSVIAIPLLIYVLKSSRYKRIAKINLRQFVFILSCIILFIACARGNLTSLKFFIF